jgi:pimeloyl-ACP methyl ester carboxylesterase
MINHSRSRIWFVAVGLTVFGDLGDCAAQATGVRAPLGSLVSIGDRRMHLHCVGSGSPTVVIESGASSFALDWALVQPEIARTSRVCTYDRAGYGWSDPSPAGDSPTRIVEDLRATLDSARERPPYVLVGASMGGIYIRMFELRYPSDVAGMVFVDPSHEDRLFVDVAGKTVPIWARTVEEMRASLPPRSAWGYVQSLPQRSPQTGDPFDRLPQHLYETRLEFDRRLIASGQTMTYDQYVEGATGRQAAFVTLHEQSAGTRPLGNRPVVVLTRGADFSQDRVDTHAALAAQSTNSRQTTVVGAGHEIHLFAPAVVIEALRDVVDAVRRGSRLPAR